jgi:TRAP-type C4-dicarboxylate transport system substrate-binding protein
MIARTLFAGLFLSAVSIAPSAAGEPLRLSVTSGLPHDHVVPRIVRTHFQDEVTRRVADSGGGEIVWDELHAGTLARMGGALEAAEDNLALFAVVAVNHETRRLPLQNLTFQMPFTTENCAVVGAAYQALHTELPGMTDDIAAARQAFVSGIASDGYNFIAVRSVRNADELRGVRVGMVDRLESWVAGVQGVPRRLPDDTMGARMEAGELDAALLPTSEIARVGLRRFADHYTRTGFGAQVPFVLTVNSERLAAWPEAVRAAIAEAGAAFTGAAAEAYCAAGAQAAAELKAQGVRAAKLLKTRRFQWADSLPPIARSWAEANDAADRPGTAAVDMYMNRLRAAGVNLLRNWSRVAPKSALDEALEAAQGSADNAARELSQVPAR